MLISLVYLALQVRKNTRAVESSTHQAMLQQQIATTSVLFSNEALDDIVRRGEADPEALTDAEWRRFSQYAFMSLNVWESAYLNYATGTIDRERFAAWDEGSKIVLDHPGYRKFWKENRDGFGRGFVEHVGDFFDGADGR